MKTQTKIQRYNLVEHKRPLRDRVRLYLGNLWETITTIPEPSFQCWSKIGEEVVNEISWSEPNPDYVDPKPRKRKAAKKK